MLRVLAAVPGAIGIGVDASAVDLARGRANAVARGLADRVEFAEEPRQSVDQHRRTWLRGYREVLGLACVTLLPAR